MVKLLTSNQRRSWRMTAALLATTGVLLSGCAADAVHRAPPAPDKPWDDPKRTSDNTPPDFGVARTPDIQEPTSTPLPVHEGPYSLASLIDLAQRNNHLTRTAWNNAREAALAVGMVEATFLPIISASAIAGKQKTYIDSPIAIGPREFETTISGVVPAISLGWLAFDFGQRAALLDATKELSRAANILFNASHQEVIREVTSRYYTYNMTREQVVLARDGLKSRQAIAAAARARRDAGLATVLDTTFSDQMVAQARLNLVNHEGLERNAYLALLAAVGLAPNTKIEIAPDKTSLSQNMRKAQTELTDEAIHNAIANRPDVAASYAAVQASDANVRAVKADFFPKVFVAGMLTRTKSNFRLQNLPNLSQDAHATGILLGVQLPIFDGGMRSARLVGAQIRREQAQENFQNLQRDAVRQIVLAQTTLQSAWQSEETARQLVNTARTAYNAALDSYREGLATITLVNEASNGLVVAREALLDAQTAVRLSTVTLAFALGELTSANAVVDRRQAGITALKPPAVASPPLTPKTANTP